MITPYIALFSWPVVSIVLFKHLRVPVAVLMTILAGYLLLPSAFEIAIPILPDLDKKTVPAMCALGLGLLFAAQVKDDHIRPGILPQSITARVLLVILIFASALTVLTNTDVTVDNGNVLPALRTYDAMSYMLSAATAVIPLLLGRKFLGHPDMQRFALKALCISALLYSLPALIEIRLSPQLHTWVYGYFQHSFAQHVRADGYRPIVFLTHGLRLGIFLCICIVATMVLARISKGVRMPYMLAGLYLLAILVLSKNLGALILAVLFVPVVFFLPRRLQMLAALGVCAVFLIYPVARSSGLIPIDWILNTVTAISPDRAYSFEFRINTEEELLAKAAERPLFGWGGWGRSLTYDPWGNSAIADGTWIIILGLYGWFGYLAQFGLIALPILQLQAWFKQLNVGHETTALAVILACNMVDLLPNSSLTPLTWTFVGALLGRVEFGRVEATDMQAAPVLTSDPSDGAILRPAYSRARALKKRVLPEPAPAAEASAAAVNTYTRQTRMHTRGQRKTGA